LDGDNTLAKDVLGRMERGELAKKSELNRYAAAGAIGGIALLAIAFIALFRRGKPEPADASEGPERAAAEPETAPDDDGDDAEARDDNDDEGGEPGDSAKDQQPPDPEAEAPAASDEDDSGEPGDSAKDQQPADPEAEAPAASDEDDSGEAAPKEPSAADGEDPKAQ
jgi:hypothetical protein